MEMVKKLILFFCFHFLSGFCRLMHFRAIINKYTGNPIVPAEYYFGNISLQFVTTGGSRITDLVLPFKHVTASSC